MTGGRFGTMGRTKVRPNKLADASVSLLSNLPDQENATKTKGVQGANTSVQQLDVSGYLLGVPLGVAVQRTNPTGHVPRLVITCVDFLNRHGLETEGLFRVPGSNRAVNQYLVDFETAACESAGEEDPDHKLKTDTHSRRTRMIGARSLFEDADGQPTADVHDVASVLLKYLRMLPEGLLTNQMLVFFKRLAKTVVTQSAGFSRMNMTKGQVCAAQSLLRLLPACHRETLHLLIALLANICSNSYINSMTSSNLAICVGRTLAGDDPSIVHVLVDNYTEVFGSMVDSGTPPAAKNASCMSMDDRALVVAALTSFNEEREQEEVVPPLERRKTTLHHPIATMLVRKKSQGFSGLETVQKQQRETSWNLGSIVGTASTCTTYYQQGVRPRVHTPAPTPTTTHKQKK
eukprot:comp16987_c0_seq1/m.15651 comp16987_c0_seq1/g.15651  ORF comp16987_c0_seq1/g.15651 comp16987_c0_seq1/m.15651 type:complete len:404 (-) comp16987_c0_seq1:875-2086(-)